MKPLLVVDGYNVIGAWELSRQKRWNIEESRDQLARRLEEYAAFHGCEVVLVFDGTRSDRRIRSEEQTGAVKTIFTRQAETADQYIERLCDGQPRHREVRVATNDSVEQTVILGRGAGRMPVRELLREVAQARSAQQARIGNPALKKSPLIQRLPAHQQAILEKMRRGQE